jgi:hypothetical protein
MALEETCHKVQHEAEVTIRRDTKKPRLNVFGAVPDFLSAFQEGYESQR